MECEKCGAELEEGAEQCGECGEAVAETTGSVEETTTGSDAVTKDATDAEAPASGSNTKIIIGVALALVAAVVGVLIWSQSSGVGSGTPQTAVKTMLDSYASYNAKGLIEATEHPAVSAAEEATLALQAAALKKQANGKPFIKDIVLGKVTNSGGTTATVEVTANWLSDPAKGTYQKQQVTLTTIKKGGKWLVLLQ